MHALVEHHEAEHLGPGAVNRVFVADDPDYAGSPGFR
jgi:hypothetical protein